MRFRLTLLTDRYCVEPVHKPTFMPNRYVHRGFLFLAQLRQVKVIGFVVEFGEVIGDRREKKLRGNGGITNRWSRPPRGCLLAAKAYLRRLNFTGYVAVFRKPSVL